MENLSTRRPLLIVLCIPMFLVLLDVMAINVAMPVLGRAFGAPTGAWSLVVDAYTVPLAAGLLPAGVAVDRIGPRRALLIGLWVFLAASLGGALAWSWTAVLAARAVQGIAAALMLPAGLAALTLTWQEPEARAKALGVWSAVSAAATALGPGAGGVLVQALNWRAVFWINVPLAAVALAGTMRMLAPLEKPRERGRPSAPAALAASVAAAGIMTSAANGTLQVVTIHLQRTLGIGAGPAGAVLLTATIPFVVLGPVSGRLVVRRGRRQVAVAGLVLGAAGLLTLGRLPGIPGLIPGLLGIGVGLGLMTSAIVGESMAAWKARPGMASGLNNALRQIGTSAGTAIGAAMAAHFTGDQLLALTGGYAGAWWLLGAAVVFLGFARGTPKPG